MSGNRDELIAGVREHLRVRFGEGAIREPDRFIWSDTEIALRSSPTFEVVISIPANGSEDANSWNEKLRQFYEQVVRPVADRTGGVAVGISEPGTEWAQ